MCNKTDASSRCEKGCDTGDLSGHRRQRRELPQHSYQLDRGPIKFVAEQGQARQSTSSGKRCFFHVYHNINLGRYPGSLRSSIKDRHNWIIRQKQCTIPSHKSLPPFSNKATAFLC